jgi:hypothetical protein
MHRAHQREVGSPSCSEELHICGERYVRTLLLSVYRYMAQFGVFVFEKEFEPLSIPNPLHILQQYLLAAAVVEFRGPAVGVAGDTLSGLKGAIILEKIRDTGRPE